MSDPLPQALILTAIVITFGVAAFMLAIIYRSWRLAGKEVVGVDEEDRRVAGRHGTDADELDPDDLAPGGPDRRARRQPAPTDDVEAAAGPAPPASRPTTSTCPDPEGAPMIRVLTPLPVLLPLLGAAAHAARSAGTRGPSGR